MPTNGVAGDAVFMLGDSDTVVWMYLNAAPPGWKALATGADTVLAVSGGSEDYSGDGGTAGGDWTWNHNHKWFNFVGVNSNNQTYNSAGTAITLSNSVAGGSCNGLGAAYDIAVGVGQSTVSVSGWTNNNDDETWRPSASIGKLFQLDTA
jgi:hypothetical protein